LRVDREIGGLGAAQIRIENETALIGMLEEHHAHRGPALGIGGGERHRGRFRFAAAGGFIEPRSELGNRVGHVMTQGWAIGPERGIHFLPDLDPGQSAGGPNRS